MLFLTKLKFASMRLVRTSPTEFVRELNRSRKEKLYVFRFEWNGVTGAERKVEVRNQEASKAQSINTVSTLGLLDSPR